MQWDCKIAVRLHLVTDAVNPPGLRAHRVLENEERIIRAAHRLFVEHGYRGTTLAAVAEAAGVAPRTVYVRFGSKAALLRRVVDVAIVGDLAPVAVAGREWFRTALSAPTLEERITAHAAGAARLMASAADVVAVAREAAPTEPLLAESLHADREATREALRSFWTTAAADGLLADGADVDWLAVTSGLLAHLESYLLLRELQPTTAEHYEEWLAETLRRLAAAAS